MAIAFQCAHCGKGYRIADSLAGKRAHCKQCGSEMKIPSAEEIAAKPLLQSSAGASPIPSATASDRGSSRAGSRAGALPPAGASVPGSPRKTSMDLDDEDATPYDVVGASPAARRATPRPLAYSEPSRVDDPAALDGFIVIEEDELDLGVTPGGSKLWLAMRAVLGLTLVLGFYLLVLLFEAAAVVVAIAIFRAAGRGDSLDARALVFAVLLLIAAVAVLWSILPRFWARSQPPGLLLDPDDQPRLFGEIESIAEAVGQIMPTEVYLCPDVNAWVANQGGALGLGGRRVMGLGLPLLRVLTVSQLRGVLAHEFGHFHGGDVLLGPWIFSTQNTIIRVLTNLQRLNTSVLVEPFRWYAQLYMSVTGSVSRRQEFAADAVAAHVIGSKSLINGLRRVHAAAVAFEPYWNSEVAPVLDAGFRPPVSDGFDRFLRESDVAKSLRDVIQLEIQYRNGHPFDTHPPLSARIDAMRDLKEGEPLAYDPAALSLLENIVYLEGRMLAILLGEEVVENLIFVQWDDVVEQVYYPLWTRNLVKYSDVLRGMTPRAIPALARNLKNFGKRLALSAGEKIEDEMIEPLANLVIGAAIAVALRRRGWRIETSPGAPIALRNGKVEFTPFGLVPRMLGGEILESDWISQCNAAGIVDLDLGTLAVEK